MKNIAKGILLLEDMGTVRRFLIAFVMLTVCAMAEARVRTGIEVLRDNGFQELKGKRIGLLTNATGVDYDLKSTVDILAEADGVNLVCLFAPEHGVRGNVYAGGTVSGNKDARTGLTVHSLYGKTKKPTKEMLAGLDAVVYDIQDIGSRSYTFISSMGKVMEACAEEGKEVIVLDRPNPLGGEKVEGPLVTEGYYSFISQFAIPYIYGLTCGELAMMLNEEGMLSGGKKCKLTVVRMEGWKREMCFAETGLRWVQTSPAIPTAEHAFFYPLSGIAGELNALQIGVGYTLPFQTFAAPWVNADSLAMELNAMRIKGILFRPIVYKPFSGIYKDKIVGGVQTYITDWRMARLTEVQFYVLEVMHRLYPEKDLLSIGQLKTMKTIDNVCGTPKIRAEFGKRRKVEDMIGIWRADEEKFKEASKKYYLY